MDPVTLALALGLGGSAASFLAQIFGTQAAASAQTGAANKAIDAQLAMFGIGKQGLAPYMSGGDKALADLMGTPAKAAVGETWRNPTTGATVNKAFGYKDAAAAMTPQQWRGPQGQLISVPFGQVPHNLINAGFTQVSKGTAAGKTLAQQGFKETSGGSAAVAATPGALPGLIAPINMDQATLENTPGYKFNLAQGLKATQSSVGARGLGISGASEKGAASYATGLASSTYEQQFQNALANKQMTYNSLFGPASLGESAAAGVGQLASGAGSGIGQNLTNIGTAQAGADLGAANAVTGAANSAGSNALIYAMLQGKGG
jgi:hypothetical protein